VTSVVVFGSVNVDQVQTVEHFPLPGETISSTGHAERLGGKGLNQVVAARLEGAELAFAGAVGNDEWGAVVIDSLAKLGVDVRFVKRSGRTGTAVITVDARGDNTIVLVPGANESLSSETVAAMRPLIVAADVVLAQLEIPLPVIELIAELCSEASTRFVLNAAPARELPPGLLDRVETLIVNETELSALTGTRAASQSEIRDSAAVLRKRGVTRVIATLGPDGAYLCDEDHDEFFPAEAGRVVDTTGAGDTFVGVYCAVSGGGISDERQAVRAALRAATASIGIAGAPAARLWIARAS
jgi:ribokinase